MNSNRNSIAYNSLENYWALKIQEKKTKIP